MKKLILLAATVLGFAVLTPSTASAGGHCRPGSTRVSYDSCGRRIVSIYTFVGHDRHGCALFRWVVQPRCDRGGYSNGGYGRGGYDRVGYGRGGYDRGGYDRRGRGCDAPRGRGGFSIRVGY